MLLVFVRSPTGPVINEQLLQVRDDFSSGQHSDRLSCYTKLLSSICRGGPDTVPPAAQTEWASGAGLVRGTRSPEQTEGRGAGTVSSSEPGGHIRASFQKLPTAQCTLRQGRRASWEFGEPLGQFGSSVLFLGKDMSVLSCVSGLPSHRKESCWGSTSLRHHLPSEFCREM